ncbi:MAG: DEAD/DEAH box helicase [Christensenellales bacterium]
MAASLEQVVSALKTLRAPVSLSEYDIHRQVGEALDAQGLPYQHEFRLLPRCRIDFLVDGIGIEVKRGRPNKRLLLSQAERYLSSPALSGIILLSERGFEGENRLAGKPCVSLSLWKLWGIAHPQGRAASPGVAPSLPPPEEPLPPKQPDEEEPPDPAYLRAAPAKGHLYGTLSYNKRSRCWQIKGEPVVTEMAKRLFPGSDGGRRGTARFSAHRRVTGDINWLMLRYPLAIAPADLDRWDAALREAREYARQKEQLFSAGADVSPPVDIFLGQLRPFQLAGFNWLLRVRRGLLADEMGLGKTVEALAGLARLGAFPCLLIVPPHLVRNWQAEIQRFLRLGGAAPRVHVLQGLKPYPLPEADIYISHYLLLRGWKEALPQLPVKALIFDEIQELRHSGTEKYSAASLLSSACERVWGLSGTPIYNNGGEIWNVVNILDFHFLGDWESFTREWCYGYGNSVVIKPQVLGEHLRREGLMLRRTKQEVLPELPDKRRLVQEIDADSVVFRRLMEPVLEKLRRWQGDESLSKSQRALLEGQISYEERQATGAAKAPYVSQFVRALIDSGEKVLLFAHHHAVMDSYRQDLKGLSPAFVTGRETGAMKEKSVERFMSGKTDLCCVSLRAASGLNLQRATCVVFGELDWSPAVHSQAEDRAHRIGQKDSLLCYYLVSPRGSDADIQERLGLKVSQFLGLMGEAPQSADDEAESAGIARRHVERLIQRWQPELSIDK